MKQIIKQVAFFSLAVFIVVSCKKEKTTQPPVANAGRDQVITLPADSTELSGSGSDPDGNIVSYRWSKISGPSFTILHPNNAATRIKNLLVGVYVLELKVKDNNGLTGTDTLIVTVIATDTHLAPVAKAGQDRTITLPNNAVALDGSASYDADGSIVAYSWRQVTGPNQAVINNSSQGFSDASNLILGTYEFELKVTDNDGLSTTDAVQVFVNAANISCAINRPFVNAQLEQIGTLSLPRQDLYTATAGNKILFAGGLLAGYWVSSRVDIYDFITNTWSTAELSQGRHGMTVASVGNKIIFAGGVDQWNGIRYTRVDIYDVVNNSWSTAELSEGRGYLASVTLGDKVFFAGGYWWDNRDYFSNRVDIYNNSTNTWSTAPLSEARQGLSATTDGNKIYFAGGSNSSGSSKRIDIYDPTSNSWSISQLSEGRDYFGSITFDNKIYWAGGVTSNNPLILSSEVEIRDILTQGSTFTCLSQAKAAFGTVRKGNEIVFFMGSPSAQPNNFDIYNTATGIWSIGTINESLNYPGIISANNKIYVAGGDLGPGGGLSDRVSILKW